MTAAAPMIITTDDALLDEVLRLSAAAGVSTEVVRRPDAGLRAWHAASAVLVGADQAQSLALLGPPRREQVHVLCLHRAADELFRAAVDVGAESVIELPDADDWLVELLTDAGDGGSRLAVTVAVLGGSGGVGASVVAGGLALTAARAAPTMLVDLDPHGQGLARLVGLEDRPGVTWSDLTDSQGRLGARALREALPTSGRLGVLGWSRPPAARPSPGVVREVVAAGQRGHDWVVLDLPRGEVEQVAGLLGRCDHVLLVVRATLGGAAAAAPIAQRIRDEAPDAAVLVRSRRGSPPADDVARAVGLPLSGELRDQRRLEEHLDLGLGPVHQRRAPLTSTCARLVERWAPAR